MATLEVGMLMEKRTVKFKLKKYDVFENLGLVAGICFTNTAKEELSHILTGRMAGKYVGTNIERLEDEYFFRTFSLVKLIDAADKSANFQKMSAVVDSLAKYYLYKKDEFEEIEDEDFIEFLNSTKKKSEFDEEAFSEETDISRMYDAIKKTIVSQDEQIMQILTALFKNQQVINSDMDKDLIGKLKENVLIYGPTGTGKTEILKRISKLYNIPIAIEDATSLSETGYVGRNVTDMLEDLYMAADKDLELAERGILVIDEFDKLAEKSGDSQSHISRFGVQRALLKLLDGSEMYFNNKKFDTSRLTVVALGAFTGIGADSEYGQLTTSDFEKFGIIRELLGRFSKTIAMNPLKKEDIVKILKQSDFSPLNTYKELFKRLNVEFEYDDEFVDYIAELAVAKNTGARSLKTVFDNCISSALFRIFAGEYSGIRLVKPDNQSKEAYILTKTKK